MTREEIDDMARALGKYVECCMTSKTRFALLVFDEETGRTSLVGTIPAEGVHELTGMVVERGRDSVTGEPR